MGADPIAGVHGCCSPDLGGVTATRAGASRDSRRTRGGQRLVFSQWESLQRATWGHQNQPFRISEVLVLVEKTQFMSRSEHRSRADVGDMGRAGRGAGGWKATERRMRSEYQNEHRACSLPVRTMPSSGQRGPALRTLVPHHQLDIPTLPVPRCEVGDWDQELGSLFLGEIL